VQFKHWLTVQNMIRCFIIIPLVLFQACSTMYIPPSMSTPLLDKKNDGQVDMGVSTNSVYLSGGYAFSEKYALIAHGNLSYFNFYKRFDNKNSRYNASGFYFDPFPTNAFAHRYAEFGVGRYNLLSSTTEKLELFGGGGYGYATENQIYKNKYWVGFVQGNMGRKWKVIELGLSFRMAYSGFHFSYHSQTNSTNDIRLKFNNIHVEPLLFFRVGYDPAHFFLRAGISKTQPNKSFSGINLGYGIEGERLRYTVLHLSAGMSFRF